MTEIEQTPGDRLRFEIILKSLAEGGNNLAILSEHDMVLDFYANLIDERLRALDNSEVEFCFSTNSERLVQKFNEILAELTAPPGRAAASGDGASVAAAVGSWAMGHDLEGHDLADW